MAGRGCASASTDDGPSLSSGNKRLFLLRHAKASRAAGCDDHERPLAPRGIWAAEAMAEHCEKRLRKVEVALCSSAIRTRETLRLLEQHLAPSCKIVVEEGLYLASRRRLVSALRGTGDHCHSLLLVGHEPGLSALSQSLCGGAGKPGAKRRLAKGLKPGSLVTIDLEVDRWSELRAGSGRLHAVVRPKDIA